MDMQSEKTNGKSIWLIMQHSMPPELGHYTRHYNFAKYLQRDGYRPTVFAGSKLHNSNVQMIGGKEKYQLYQKTSFPFVFIKTMDYKDNKLLRIIAMFQFHWNLYRCRKQFEKPDVVLGSSSYPLSSVLAILLAKKYKCKSIVEVRDLWPESIVDYLGMSKNNPIIKLLYWVEKWMYIHADKIVFTMEGGAQYIAYQGWDTAHGGKIDLSKVSHINNGVDLEVFQEELQQYPFYDKDLSDPEKTCIVYTGSIRKANNIGFLVDAAKRLENTNVYLLIWGNGNEKDQLAKRAADEGITHIIFKNHVDKLYIPSLLQQADVVLMHQLVAPVVKEYGYSPNKLFDYLAGGKPVISDIDCGPYELVARNAAGIVTSSVDADRFVQDVIAFVNNERSLVQASENAKKLAKEYSFEVLIKKLEALF